eukprot:CAMPEP_0179244584 /NCGR_PEP_ID=MMETSP0797-20121207/18133_1 /TAXON_ID=47934 /ORGANISM="Dinophysis acuminata, Strain DAEP01" /LENGTH=394 /DNA_ID=CAMNT_0020952105 /DNA_START=50 /DNA_END=1234 /DNA_ORIENTATION=+
MAVNAPSDNLYITGLPGHIDEAAVKQILGQYSPVVQCKVLPQMQGDRRAAFARFEDTAAATWLIEQLNGNIPQGLTDPIKVSFAAPPGSSPSTWSGDGDSYGKAPNSFASHHQSSPYAPTSGHRGGDRSEPHENLYVTGLPETFTQEDLTTLFGKYGTITQSKVLGAKYGSTAALIRWSSVQEATWVRDTLNGQVPPGLQTPVEVRFADKGPSQAASGQPQFTQWSQTPENVSQTTSWGGGKGAGKRVPNDPMDMGFIMQQFEASGALPGGTGYNNQEQIPLYINGLPPSCRDVHLYKLFSPFGPIAPKGVRAVTGGGDSCKGFGFVNFLDMNAAQNAIMIMNGAQLPDGTIMGVSVKAEKGSNTHVGKQLRADAEPVTVSTEQPLPGLDVQGF